MLSRQDIGASEIALAHELATRATRRAPNFLEGVPDLRYCRSQRPDSDATSGMDD